MKTNDLILQVVGMHCAGCKASVEKILSSLPSVSNINIQLLTGTVSLTYVPEKTPTHTIIKNIENLGFKATVISDQSKRSTVDEYIKRFELNQQTIQLEAKKSKHHFFYSLIFLIPLMYVSMGHMLSILPPIIFTVPNHLFILHLLEFILTLPILFINRNIFIRGIKSLFHKAPSMDTLIGLGSGIAFIYSVYLLFFVKNNAQNHLYLESAGMILTIVAFGRAIESKSKIKTANAQTTLFSLVPKTSCKKTADGFQTVSIDSLVIGDIVQVKTSETIPVDGIIVDGTGEVDESMLTGESLPIEKHVSMDVYTGTRLSSGVLYIKTTKTIDETMLFDITKLVDEASQSKAPIQRLADKIASVFVPIVLVLSLLVFLVWLLFMKDLNLAIHFSTAILLISCPCALGLATPLAIVAGTGIASKHGILIKSGTALETLSQLSTLVLDKTGTLTNGTPIVSDVIPTTTKHELLTIAATLEQFSEHILAKAILTYTKTQSIKPAYATNFKALPGYGVCCSFNDHQLSAGNLKYVKQYLSEQDFEKLNLIDVSSHLATEGKTPLFFFKDDQFLGTIALKDELKPNATTLLSKLNDFHIQTVLLTGDNKKTATAIAFDVGINTVISDVLPKEKQTTIKQLQKDHHIVVMVGDGINDAPALKQANVGIAIGNATDGAMASADVILMKNNIMDIYKSILIGKNTLRTIKENLFWAFIYNIICIPIASGIFYIPFHLQTSPMLASFLMTISSLFVVLNTLRLPLKKLK